MDWRRYSIALLHLYLQLNCPEFSYTTNKIPLFFPIYGAVHILLFETYSATGTLKDLLSATFYAIIFTLNTGASKNLGFILLDWEKPFVYRQDKTGTAQLWIGSYPKLVLA